MRPAHHRHRNPFPRPPPGRRPPDSPARPRPPNIPPHPPPCPGLRMRLGSLPMYPSFRRKPESDRRGKTVRRPNPRQRNAAAAPRPPYPSVATATAPGPTCVPMADPICTV